MNKTTAITLVILTAMTMGCTSGVKQETAARVQSLEEFIVDLETKATSPANEPIDWESADARFDELFQPSLRSSADPSLTGYRKSQEYLAGRYAALRVRNATVDDIRAWMNSASQTWQGFIEGLEDP